MVRHRVPAKLRQEEITAIWQYALDRPGGGPDALSHVQFSSDVTNQGWPTWYQSYGAMNDAFLQNMANDVNQFYMRRDNLAPNLPSASP